MKPIMKTPNLETIYKTTVGKRVAHNTGLLVGAKFLGVLMGAATLFITEWALDDQVAFGSILFLHAYMLFFAEVATFHSWQSIIRFGSEDIERKDATSLSKLIKFSLKIDGLSAILAYIGAVLLFVGYAGLVKLFPVIGPSDEGFDIVALQPYIAAYCTVVLFQVTGFATGILRLFNKFDGLAIALMVMPALRLLGAIFAAKQGWGIIGFLCVWWFASVVAYLFRIALGFFELHKRNLLGLVLKTKQNFTNTRDGLWGFVWKSNVDSTLAAGVSQLPLILVMAVFGPAFVAIYRIAEEFAKLLSEGVKLIEQVIYPELARIMSVGKGNEIWKLVIRASGAALLIGMVAAVMLFLLGPTVMSSSLGEEYQASIPIAVLLVFGAALFAASAPLFPVFYAANKPERAIYVRVFSLISYVLAFFVLTKYFGEIGAPMAVIFGSSIGIIIVGIMTVKTLNDIGRSNNQSR